MEVWNEFRKPLPFEKGKCFEMRFFGETEHLTKNNKKINVLLFKDSTLISYWTPVFTIAGANITIDRLKEYTTKPVKITCLDTGYLLEFA